MTNPQIKISLDEVNDSDVNAKPHKISKNKKILLAIAVCLALFLILYRIDHANTTHAIERVLVEASNITNNLELTSKSVQFYIEHMDSIDLSGCPDDFQNAYRTHIRAWRSFYPIVKELEEFSGGDTTAAYVLAGLGEFLLTGSPGLGTATIYASEMQNLETRWEAIVEDINETYAVVLNIAQEYGVDIEQFQQ